MAPLRTFDLGDPGIPCLQRLPNLRWKPVYEFRTQFDRCSSRGVTLREDPATDSTAGFEDEHRKPRAAEIRGGSKSGSAGTDHDNVSMVSGLRNHLS